MYAAADTALHVKVLNGGGAGHISKRGCHTGCSIDCHVQDMTVAVEFASVRIAACAHHLVWGDVGIQDGIHIIVAGG